MARQGFKHRGEVSAVDLSEGVVMVSMRSSTACDGCHAKGHCTSGGGVGEDGKVRVMRVVSDSAAEYSVGDDVEVGISYSIGFYAIMVAYILPLVLFVLSIAVLIGVGVEQGVAALVGTAVGAIYYGVVYAMRDRFESVVHFSLRRL